MVCRVCSLLACLLTGSALFAQVTLMVTDADGRGIERAEAYVAETGRVYAADGRGEIVFATDTTLLSLTLFAEGYTTLRYRLDPNEADRQTVVLLPLSQQLAAVTVVAQEREREALGRLRAVEGTAIYAGRKTEVVRVDALTVNLASNQARQLYAEVSGLNIYEGDDAGLQLSIGGRGLDPNRTASFNTRQNGYDISADVLGYPESYYTPPAEAIERIEVVRGAASLQYGTQFGGLVNFVFREPDRSRRFGITTRQTVGSNGLFTSFNSVSGQVGALGYYGFYNYKRGDGYRPNAGFSSHNAHLHLDFAPAFAPNTTLAVEYTYLSYLAQQAGGLTDAQFYREPFGSNRTRNWFAVDWQLYSLRIEHKFSPQTNASLQLFGLDASRQAVGFRTNRVSQVDDLTAARDLLIGNFRNHGVEGRLLHRYELLGRSAVGLIGFKYYRARNGSVQGAGSATASADFGLASDRFPGFPNQSAFQYPNRNVALFGEHIVYLTDRLTVTPGLRYEYIRTESSGSFRRLDFDLAGNVIRDGEFRDDRTFERNLILLGLGLGYRLGEGSDLFANLSQNYRSVTFNDIRTVNPSFQVDPDIRDERGYTADAGLRGARGGLDYQANVFLLRYGDRLGEVLTPELRVDAAGATVRTGRIIRLRSNVGSALIYGLESLLTYRLLEVGEKEATTPYRLEAFANTSVTYSRYTDSDIAGVVGREVEFIPRLNLKTGLRFGFGNLLGSLQYTYLSRQYTDASNAAQDRADNQSGIVGSIPAYGLADLSLSYRWRAFRLEAGVNNLTNHTYFARRATGYPGPGIIPNAPRTVYLTAAYTLP